VASTIIVILLVALTTTGRNTLAGFSYSNERAQATYLAQEGLEVVRQIRDTNWIDSDPATSWDSLMSESATATKKYCIDFSSNFTLNLVTDTIDCSSYEDLASLGNFKRSVKISKVTDLIKNKLGAPNLSNYARKVEVTVSWKTSGGADREVKTSEILTNWRDN
ncbi:MAG TPA: hypothetical protein PK263_04755, partial [bacterium]|nr:hypothetical protein [bacterium]